MTARIIRYVGGPLGGHERDAAEMTDEQLRTDRADYEPDEGGDPLVWRYRGPVPG